MRLLAVVALLGSALLCAPAQAQTDDRVLNDILTLYRSEAIIDEFRKTCASTSGAAEIAAAFAGWDERAFSWRADAMIVQAQRPPMPAGALTTADTEGRDAFRKDLTHRRDVAAFCRESVAGLTSGAFDFENWHPSEVARLKKARAGEMPLLDVAGSAEVAQAIGMKGVFYLHDSLFALCAERAPPARQYEDALSEWRARNSYVEQLADRVLKNWGALAPRRFETVKAEAAAEAQRMVENGYTPAICADLRDAAIAGNRDFDVINPEAFDTVRRNAEIIP